MAANECMYFYEDEVYRITKKGNLEFGMVLQNADVDTDEEESGSEEMEKLKNGHILVAWHPRGEEDVIHEKKVGLSDRCLMPGDIVRRLVPGQDTQRGYCRSITMKATVQVVGTRQVIYNVASDELIPLEEFAPDIAVCMDAWVGIINSVTSEVELQFPDGSTCLLTDEEAADLDDPSGRRLTDSEFRVWFYPGQKLLGPIKAFQNAVWTSCYKDTQALRESRNKRVKVTVTKYHVTSLNVHWQCRAVTAEGSLDQPSYVITGEDLKRVRMLNTFEPCTLQLGDMNTYKLRDTDVIMTMDEWRRMEKNAIRTGRKPPPPGAPAAAAAAAAAGGTVGATGGATGAQTRLQPPPPPPPPSGTGGGTGGGGTGGGTSGGDGAGAQETTNASADSAAAAAAAEPPAAAAQALTNGGAQADDEMGSVSSYSSVGSAGKRTRRGLSLKTHVMKKRKLKRSRPCRQPALEARTFTPGETLVVETAKTVSWVTVVWQDGSVEENIPSISLHPSHHLDDHEFFPGDYVVEQKTEAGGAEYGVVQRVDHAGRTALVNWYQIYLFGSDASPQMLRQTEASVYDLSDHPDFRYRPGTVVVSVSPAAALTGAGDGDGDGEDGGEETAPDAGDREVTLARCVTNGPAAPPASPGDPAPPAATAPDTAPPPSQPADDPAPPGCGHAGQVLDVLTSGEVKVWWANGRTSNCYPQDLFRVGEYDSDEGELWDNHDSADSTESQWETQSEESVVAGGEEISEPAETPTDDRLKPRLAAIIEKIRLTMSRLEAMFAQNAALQSPIVMRQLLDIYKNSRCLDKLMDTAFFDESHFGGLVNQIRERSKALAAQRPAAATMDRLANSGDAGADETSGDTAAAGGGGGALVECGEFCTRVKAQLLLAYEEVVRRYGISLSSAGTLAVDASPTGDDSGINGDPRTDAEGVADESELTSPDRVKRPSSPGAGGGDPAAAAAAAVTPEFTTLPSAPDGHKFKSNLFQPAGADAGSFMKAVRREIRLLNRALPEGIVVKGYDDRMDLYSVMISGPRRTPYEDGLFFFEVQLSPEYPRTPPVFHYISYCSDRLNPNLYEDGKVCVSLLGTWGGRGSEVWSASSSLMQVLVSIQGLILVAEPYYNEAGYEKQRGSQQGAENSRLYNEMVILKLVQSLTAILRNPPGVFVEEVTDHLRTRAHKLIARLRHWLTVSETSSKGATPTAEGAAAASSEFDRPDFPLLPASRGFGITLRKTLQTFEKALQECGVPDASASASAASAAAAAVPDEATSTSTGDVASS